MDDNVVELDEYRACEDVVKRRMGAKFCIFSAELENGDIATYIPHDLSDMVLVYMIQTLQDRRIARLD